MKQLYVFINEKLKVSSKSKINKNEPLEPEEVEGPETPGKDYFDEGVVIIGWPFKKKNDDNYNKTKEYIRTNGYRIFSDLEDIDDKEMFDWFCYAKHPDDDTQINCYVYGPEGVQGYSEK
jgi:hypothetical protein